MEKSAANPGDSGPVTADMTTVRLTLDALAAGGEAVGRLDGMVVFVAGGLPGETVTAQIVERRRTFARARLISVIEPSPDRVSPRCQHYGTCGGCTLQHMAWPAQLRAKRAMVREQLARIGQMADVEVRECLVGPSPWGYRNSARLAFDAKGRPGYRAASSHDVIAVSECPILEPALEQQLHDLGRHDLGRHDLGRQSPGAAEAELRVPMQPIEVDGRAYRVPAGAFFQVNTAVAALLVHEVMTALAPKPGEAVLDLYCGVGLFTVPIAERTGVDGHVVGVEISEAAIRGAAENLREYPHAALMVAPVERAIKDERITGVHWDAVVLDPPRRGVERAALDGLVALNPGRIVYVSCDPATFARDASVLASHGYRLEYAQPLDMFPQTAHVETVGKFVRGAAA